MLPNILATLGSATLSATGTLIPSGIKGTGSIDTSQVDWLAVQFTFGGTATVVAEGSFDNGTTWAALPVVSSSGAVATSFSASGIWFIQVAAPIARLRVSAWTSGAVTLIGGVTDILNAPVALPSTVTTTPVAASLSNIALAATTNTGFAKASAGNLYGLTCFNGTAAPAFVKLFNKASAPVLGTDTPIDVIPVAAGASVSIPYGAIGRRFGTGIAYAVTLNASDSDATALGTAGGHLSLDYI